MCGKVNKMKRIISTLLILTLAALAAFSVVSCGDSGKTKIAIVQPMDHTSLNHIRDKIISTLEELGYTSENTIIIQRGASNDS